VRRFNQEYSKWAKPKGFSIATQFHGLYIKIPKGLDYCSMELSLSIGSCPLVSAVAAGNQVVLKPSELTGNTACYYRK
jgi:aldehyde dehydrogenase (NAD+)